MLYASAAASSPPCSSNCISCDPTEGKAGLPKAAAAAKWSAAELMLPACCLLSLPMPALLQTSAESWLYSDGGAGPCTICTAAVAGMTSNPKWRVRTHESCMPESSMCPCNDAAPLRDCPYTGVQLAPFTTEPHKRHRRRA